MSAMTAPIRIQLSRVRGWRMPPNTVKVSRPSVWGNPYRVGHGGVISAGQAVQCFEGWLTPHIERARPFRLEAIESLRGKNLACWCKLGDPCHADVLLRLANQEPKHG